MSKIKLSSFQESRNKDVLTTVKDKDVGVFRRRALMSILERLDELDGEDRGLLVRMLMPYAGINISHNNNCVIVY